MTGLIVRLGGIARTWVMVAACSGWSGRARPSTERIAVSRALRVLLLLPRSCSRWSRNPVTCVAVTASKSSASAGIPSVAVRYFRSIRQVSR
jgi:hypothetical protein